MVDFHVLPETLERYRRELFELKKRYPIIKAEMQRTAEEGDFSENAGYQAAKRELRRVNSRMTILEDRITQAIVIDGGPSDGSIGIGSTVVLHNGQEKLFRIVGPLDVNLLFGQISYRSPLGAALMGKRTGDEVQVNNVTWKIIRVGADR
ncbi:hypothetical protein A3C17_02720 [Candidatus Uhrbacteria bacterium RIFCSPHIGHO2_02_FULL_53_13]|uniref:Transcription elongation factor GreA n=2 Tax=Candidatus Uhriibacteriota TaxID=1752732 RepID=A0A1F7U022_9BACT|nr:MAG: hypothetical protein A3C17_02720 [Candidatus Uhrbacteria bacterium RIFCSPHIGHO2_02_FULL_53_13]OGL90113.1 MAG: hypothetical protein A3I45_00330 [Candidatus Uhrbacteria bacterium RIFCSPLOWO2_02_FULL_53_10]